MTTTFRLNGSQVEISAPADTPAVYVLRNELGMKSVRLGCGAEQCGACTVMVDAEARTCCTTPIEAFEGHDVQTVEGLADGEVLTALQAALLRHNAAQCGYCLSGIVISATAMFRRIAAPTDAEIKASLAECLCRCGAQPRILRALRELAGR